MSSTDSRPAASRPRRLARRIMAVVRECNDSQRRMAAIRTAPDRYTAHPDAAPDTYAEFLFRTSGLLLHEPSARSRARRHGALR
jgi:hypothetical protein